MPDVQYILDNFGVSTLRKMQRAYRNNFNNPRAVGERVGLRPSQVLAGVK